jgi:uncharacterized membrane protein YfcA
VSLFDVVLTAVSLVAGAIAAVSGFGVGSLLTPLLAVVAGTKAAVAAVAIPHVVASGLRFWQLRQHVDWTVVRSFGLTSAAGGLVGGLLFGVLQSAVLTVLFAALLIFAGVAGVTGLAERMRFRGVGAWIAGAISGVFGGLVGNQGGIRSAAMLGFNVRRDAFVATATAIALIVDGARLPVYLATDWDSIARLGPEIGFMTLGAVAGTLLGRRALARIPEPVFKRVVSGMILLLGLWMAGRGWTEWRA